MQCVRCQAKDDAPARFCRVCGYPYAFDEFLLCPVCGGEVRSGIKICPGCHHQFAVPVAASPGQPRRRGSRYVLSAAFALVVGSVFFYGSAGKEIIQRQLEPVLQAHLSLAPTGQTETEAMPQTSTSENASPVTIAAAEPERTLKPDEARVPILKEPKARVVPLEPKSARGEATTRRANVAQAQVAKTESETQGMNFLEAGAAGPKVREELVVKDPDPVLQQAGPARQKPSPNNGASDAKGEKERAGVSAAKVERGKVVTAKRPAPVVERSRVAEPGQVNLLARQAHQMHRCDGKWEGECRQFPDHKPNW